MAEALAPIQTIEKGYTCRKCAGEVFKNYSLNDYLRALTEWKLNGEPIGKEPSYHDFDREKQEGKLPLMPRNPLPRMSESNIVTHLTLSALAREGRKGGQLCRRQRRLSGKLRDR
jgi:hypothetical protein